MIKILTENGESASKLLMFTLPFLFRILKKKMLHKILFLSHLNCNTETYTMM